MQYQELKDLLTNKLSPKAFRLNSETYGLHLDRLRNNKIIKKVMLTIDLTLEAIHFALKNKVGLIISHHSLINNPINKFNQDIMDKLFLLSKYPISIFILNSTFIAAEGGVSDTLVNVLFLKLEDVLEIKNNNGKRVPIGRICSILNYPNEQAPFTLEDLIKRIKRNLNLKSVPFVGDLGRTITKICIIGGDISNIKLIKKIVNIRCDCYISGKINYFEAILARDLGLNLIEISHYKNEILAMKKLSNVLSLEFPQVEFLFFDSKDPIKTYT
ncbi:MAG: Nif3-like dinuclear metal center hexameric protein [Candidatus Hodarchaeota archaeon]